MSSLPHLAKIEVKSTDELRKWLADNHTQNQSYWLITYKKHSPHYVSWADTVDELLCVGWIDSTTSKLDADRTMRVMCKRKPKSVWSKVNKDKIARLTHENRIQKTGMEAILIAQQNGMWEFLDEVEACIIPDDLQHALKQAPHAFATFTARAPSKQKESLYWIKTAKREETRAIRIAKTVEKMQQITQSS